MGKKIIKIMLSKIKEQEDRKAEAMQARKMARLLRIAKGGMIANVILLSACAMTDPASSGFGVGSEAWNVSVPAAGSVTKTITISRQPETEGIAGQVYNRRSFKDWLFNSKIGGVEK